MVDHKVDQYHGPIRVTFDDQTQNLILSSHINKAIRVEFDGHGLRRTKNYFRNRVVRLRSEVSIVIFTLNHHRSLRRKSTRWITLKKIKYVDKDGKEVKRNCYIGTNLPNTFYRELGNAQNGRPASQPELMASLKRLSCCFD